MIEGKLYIDGKWSGTDLNPIRVINPANGDVIGTVPNAGKEETRQAIQAASKAFLAWSKTTAPERAKYLRKLYDFMIRDKEEIGRLITLEMGKPLVEAIGEVEYAASFIEWYAEQSKRIYGETIPSNHEHKRMLVMKQPVGVVAAITPWNFPAAMLTRKMGPALAAGCTIVIKPSSLTPLTAIHMAKLCEMAGFPKGTVNLITGSSRTIASEIMMDQRVRKITFTGSTEVGKELMKQSSEQMKKVSLELGGHAPMIILDDADIDKAVQGVIASKFRNAGQTCICGNRIYVQAAIYDAFMKRFNEEVIKLKVGNGMKSEVQIGPLINKEAYDKVNDHVQNALELGAKIAVGGSGVYEAGGYYYHPTVIEHVNSDMRMMQEETFGPIAPVQRIETDEEAIRLANATSFGLAAYVFTESMSRGTRIVEALEYGIIGWNDGAPSAAQAPFGGIKESGTGREGGHQGIEEYLEIKYISIGI
jgi:succinate-semialdehyde dehydrogenase/glutarate-semialdehyde dehydrogenase